MEAGPEVRPTQPPHPLLIVDVPSGYPEDLELYGSPDTVNVEDILSIDVTPPSSISTSVMDATPCPDMSVPKSASVDLGTSMSVDFDDRMQGIESVEIADTAATGASGFRNPSHGCSTLADVIPRVFSSCPMNIVSRASAGRSVVKLGLTDDSSTNGRTLTVALQSSMK